MVAAHTREDRRCLSIEGFRSRSAIWETRLRVVLKRAPRSPRRVQELEEIVARIIETLVTQRPTRSEFQIERVGRERAVLARVAHERRRRMVRAGTFVGELTLDREEPREDADTGEPREDASPTLSLSLSLSLSSTTTRRGRVPSLFLTIASSRLLALFRGDGHTRKASSSFSERE